MASLSMILCPLPHAIQFFTSRFPVSAIDFILPYPCMILVLLSHPTKLDFQITDGTDICVCTMSCPVI